MDLEKLRSEIALIDRKVMKLVSERTLLAGRIGEIKHSEGLPIKDPEVETRVVARYRDCAAESGLEPEEGERLARLLIDIAIRKETQR